MRSLLLFILPTLLSGLIYNERCIGCIEIDVYFHLVAYDDGTFFFHNKSESISTILPMVESNMEVANQLFNETPFTFNWKNADSISTVNSTDWTRGSCTAVRTNALQDWNFEGDALTTVNVYMGHHMKVTGYNTSGCGSFPWVPETQYVSMLYDALPPGGNGLLIAHEFGHWLGLLHTHQSLSGSPPYACAPSDNGDLVDDTPIQLPFNFSLYANETSADSCPTRQGEDAFWNIMGGVCKRFACYGDRAYFTEGQIERMYLEWLVLRQQEDDCTDDQFVLQMNITGLHVDGIQIKIFDEDGNEALNLRKLWLNTSDWLDQITSFQPNLCLCKNTSYTVVVHAALFSPSNESVEFSIEGKLHKLVSIRDFGALGALIGNATSFVIPALATSPQPTQLLSTSVLSVYCATNLTECMGANDVLLTIDYAGEGLVLKLFGEYDQLEIKNEGPVCIAQDARYTLTAYMRSFPYIKSFPDAPLEVTMDGKAIFSKAGPFYPEVYTSHPSLFSIWIDPSKESSGAAQLEPSVSPSNSATPLNSSASPSSAAAAPLFPTLMTVLTIIIIVEFAILCGTA